MKQTLRSRFWASFFLFILVTLEEAFSSPPQYLWVKEPGAVTMLQAQMGIGLLDPDVMGRGVLITNEFGLEYALNPDTGIRLDLPLAGTLSTGPDGYSIGNIGLEIKYGIPMDRVTLTFGADLSLPTARTDARIGAFTRRYVAYTKDQFALSPYVAINYSKDRIAMTADFGTDLQIYTKSAAGRDRIEDVLFYDAGAAINFFENLWGSVEFSGFSTLTYSGSNQTSLYAGPGFRYQDPEISFGVHVVAPFRKPDRDVYNVMFVFDCRVGF
jgi:hypothetical protein